MPRSARMSGTSFPSDLDELKFDNDQPSDEISSGDEMSTCNSYQTSIGIKRSRDEKIKYFHHNVRKFQGIIIISVFVYKATSKENISHLFHNFSKEFFALYRGLRDHSNKSVCPTRNCLFTCLNCFSMQPIFRLRNLSYMKHCQTYFVCGEVNIVKENKENIRER